MQSCGKYEDVTHDNKTLIMHTLLNQGPSSASSLDKLLRHCKDCCVGAKLHTTVSYQKLQLQLLKGTVCQPQRVFLGNNLLLVCTPTVSTPTISEVDVKIYRLFASCSSTKRKSDEE